MTAIDGDRLKQIDALVSPLAAFVARAAALRPGARDPRPVVVRPGGMGDLILAHLAMEEIGIDPRGVDWIIEKRSEPWARHAALPHLSYDRHPAALLARAGRALLVVNTEQRFALSQAVARGLTGRGGRLVCFASSRAASAAHVTVPYDWDREHETVAFERLFASAFDRRAPALGSSPAPRERRRPATTGTVVALGGQHAPSRAYDAHDWLRHIERFCTHDGPLTIVGGPGEHDLADGLVGLLGGRARFERVDFDAVCARIASASRVLTIDGGLVHVASYYGVPATVIFTSGRDHKWAPIGAGSEIVARRDLACRPCTTWGQVPPCPYAYRCRDLTTAVTDPWPRSR